MTLRKLNRGVNMSRLFLASLLVIAGLLGVYSSLAVPMTSEEYFAYRGITPALFGSAAYNASVPSYLDKLCVFSQYAYPNGTVYKTVLGFHYTRWNGVEGCYIPRRGGGRKLAVHAPSPPPSPVCTETCRDVVTTTCSPVETCAAPVCEIVETCAEPVCTRERECHREWECEGFGRHRRCEWEEECCWETKCAEPVCTSKEECAAPVCTTSDVCSDSKERVCSSSCS